jgi:KDO2-lipid IV(A) lauroyltransferase
MSGHKKKKKRKKKEKSAFTIGFEFFWINAFIQLVRALPMRMAYALASIVASLAFVFDKRHRNRTIQHITHAGMAKDASSAVKLAKKNFKSLARLGVDTFKVDAAITDANVSEHVKLTGSPETLKAVFEDKLPIIALAPHLANVAFIPTVYGIMTGKTMLSVIRPYDNPKLGEEMKRIQIRYGSEQCDQKGAMKSLLSALRKGDSIGMVVDQHPGRKNGILTTFFGHPALTHVSPAALHLKTGVPLCPLAMPQSSDPGTFEFVFKDLIVVEPSKDRDADIAVITQKCTDAMEELIREYPEQWFWSHRRWLDINRKGYDIQALEKKRTRKKKSGEK